jgi:hypothetical protein
MNLRGSIVSLQRSGAHFYSKLSQIFAANPVIGEAWLSMSRDLEQQGADLRALPLLFWKSLTKEESRALAEALKSCRIPGSRSPEQGRSLIAYFQAMLDFEEPLILHTYIPLIRRLREGWYDRALNFYIVVKAHVARLQRIIQPFSGDPVLMQRLAGLLSRFEHDVQAPAGPPATPQKRRKNESAHAASRQSRTKSPIAAGAARSKLSLRSAAGRRPKAVVADLKIARRRAGR